ncbi:Hydrocephalus-inducing [Amphibalanus amphitrite]|uniref:Hydrocephalus-inducing n=1 Tax=Amphibalanus amphitrite TaxID=1232801 RepID=A0A6A4VF87_AMPAM|nr:Hydrocephalus-inducing [Amphibalanus amphitrite]
MDFRATTVDEFRVPTDLGVTHVLLSGALDCRCCYRLLVESGVLPSPSSVRDDMGQGSEGPPLTPCRTFTVLKRPPLRALPETTEPVFTFRLDDAERAAIAEAAAAEKEEKAQRITPEKSPPPKRRGQRRLKGKRRSDPSLAADQRTGGSMGGECDTDLATAIRQALHRDDPVVSGHRWVVPAEGELTLVVHFEVNRPGRYQARLQLETAGTRRRYTLECSGSCVLPLINRKIKTLYAKVPMRSEDYGTEHGVAFIRGTRTLSFGPLPVVKPAAKQQPQAEITMENISPLPVEITFHLFNDTFKVPPFQLWPMSLSLAPGEKDYLQVMALPPAPQPYEDMLIGCVKDNPDPWITKLTCVGAKPEVHVDKRQLTFDRVLLLRRETRRLVLTNRSLIPLQFRVVDTEQLGEGFTFRPKEGTLMPLGVSDIEVEFSPIRPCLYHNKKIKLEITEHFEEPAADDGTTAGGSGSDNSATTSSPRSPRTTLGILQSETITVSAEGFDVAVDLMFPKGLATGVDFGTIKVKEESKQTFTIKNKGKYEIMFKAWLEDPEPVPKGAKSLTHGFHISPDRGILHPHERPLNIQMWFSTDSEIWIKKSQMLRVQILDFHKKEEGEVIALIPVCVSVRALFCKYSVTPSHELHLGHFPVAVRKTGFFVIKNDGKFDFSYHIVRKNVEPTAGGHDSPQAKKRGRTSGGKGGSSSSKSTSQENTAGPISTASVVQKLGGGQSSKGGGSTEARAMKLTAGIYTLQPAMGTIPVSSQAVVNVEAVSSEPISDVQELVIRISDAGDGVGIPFRLLGNVTTASIRDQDGGIVSIFEEHAVVDSLKSYRPGSQLKAPPGGVYGRAENRFQLSPTLLGDSARVSFKVHNTSMVPVDVVIAVKQPGPATTAKSKAVSETGKLFDVSPTRANISVHGFITVTVTFTPNALQTFVNVVDIQVEEPTGVDRSKGISFEVSGEGTLPLLDVLEPSEVTRQQEPLLHFLSTRLGDSAAGTVRLRNAGLVECMVDLLLAEGRDLFSVVPDERTLQYSINGERQGMISSNEYVLGTLCLPAGAEAVLAVTFCPRQVGRCSGLLLLSVNYNAYQRQAIRLDGHGYNSGVLVHGLPVSHYVPPPPPPPPPKSQKEEPPPQFVLGSDMPQLQYTLEFVSCYIGVAYNRQFRMENCSDNSRYRFEWHNSQYLTFSPAFGHLAPREIKTITVTFVANEAINFEKVVKPSVDVPPPTTKRGKAKVEPAKPEHSVSCVVTAIAYPGELDQQHQQPETGSSWDERSRTMQLVPAEPSDSASRPEEADRPAETVSRLLPEREPAFEELAPAPALRLDVPAVLQTDLARVRFTGGAVSFDDTFMFQARTEEVTLENIGLAEVRYSWSLEFVPPSARPVSAETQVYSGELDSQTSVAGSQRSDSGASFLQLMTRRISELADYVPFTIAPASGTVPPGQAVTFTVRFAPLDILEYSGTLKCSIPYLSEDAPAPTVSVHGCGVLPVCHFDLDQTGCRENGDELTPPSDCDLRVVTIDAVGVNRKVARTFSIINPTEASWHYTFSECSRDDGPRDAWFNCANASGMVNSGQRARVTFEFFPRAEGTFESRWQFFIREHRLTVDLVLVGRAREPLVYATEPVLRLPAVLTGTTSHGQLTLVNEESEPLRFQLDLDSCYSASQALRLTVLPIEGLVPARGAATLQLQYLAVADGPAEFTLQFYVESRHAPLTVAVSAEGYTLQAEATLVEPRGRDHPLSAATVNQIDLGLIPCRETVYRAISVVNTGRFPFTVELENATESPPPRTAVTLDPDHRELVEPRKRVTCKFGVCCSAKVKFPNIKILVKVTNGPCFVLMVRGSAEPPNIWYSHSAIDFGPCFLYREGMPTIVSELRVENRDRHPVSVGVSHDDVSFLKIDFKQTVIAPGEKAIVPIVFVPLEVRRYLHTVNIVINGQVHRALRVAGQGIRFQVEVANSEHKQLVLGDFRAGQRLQRSIAVVNRADAAVRCQFQLTCSSPGLQNLTSPVLRLRPAEAEIRPRGSVVLELQCFSKIRQPWFQEQVRLTALGITHTLLTVEGTCQGMDLRLDVTTLPFGAVAAYSRVKRNVCIINDGDIGARFRWPAEPLQPEFSIWPAHGYAAPKSRVVCEVTMHPRELSSVIKKEGVTCEVENYGSLPLTLTGCCVPVTVAKEPLQFTAPVRTEDVRSIQIANKTNTGWEVEPVVPLSVPYCTVCYQDQHGTNTGWEVEPVVPLSVPYCTVTNTGWEVEPVVSGQFWSGQEVLSVPAQSVAVYSVTYKPMVMTATGQKHTGSVFLALPDGQALLYSLLGTAEPPLPVGRLTADITCKTSHQETVDVTNWLTEPQRFAARAEVVRSEKEKDKSEVASVRLSGLDYLDVPALATVPYTLNVYYYKEGNFHVKLSFRNEDTGEFLFYDLGYRVAKTHERQRVELHTVVRKAVQHSVLLERPLDSPMTCQVTCNMSELILGHHGTIHFPAGQEARVSFEVLPLREGCTEAPLDVHSQEMGTYGFEVSVTARRPPLAGTVRLSCPLGQSVSRPVKYTNYSRSRAEYTTQLVALSQLSDPPELSPTPETSGRKARGSGRDRDDEKPKTFADLLTQLQNKGDGKELTVDRAVYASPGWPQGVEASLDLAYEPIDIGTQERGLVLSSPTGGEYRFAVYATCTLPEPQGPLNIKSGANVVIPFKNIFPATAPYSFYVDSPYFSLSKTPDTIRAKKDIRVTVSFDVSRGPPVELSAGRPLTACLTISGPTLPHGHTPAWRYYLRGLPASEK